MVFLCSVLCFGLVLSILWLKKALPQIARNQDTEKPKYTDQILLFGHPLDPQP